MFQVSLRSTAGNLLLDQLQGTQAAGSEVILVGGLWGLSTRLPSRFAARYIDAFAIASGKKWELTYLDDGLGEIAKKLSAEDADYLLEHINSIEKALNTEALARARVAIVPKLRSKARQVAEQTAPLLLNAMKESSNEYTPGDLARKFSVLAPWLTAPIADRTVEELLAILPNTGNRGQCKEGVLYALEKIAPAASSRYAPRFLDTFEQFRDPSLARGLAALVVKLPPGMSNRH